MKFNPYLSLLLLIPILNYGQSKETNTEEYFDGNKLAGTTILSGSRNNMESRFLHGFQLYKIDKSECLNDGFEKNEPTKINQIEIKNDSTMVIQFTINENCCHDFLGEIEITKDNVLNLIYHGYGSYCACGCCFGLTYELFLIREEDFNLEKVKSAMINGNKETLSKIEWVKK